MSPSFVPLTVGVGSLNSLPNETALSRARPITERQSGRLEVISNSTTVSLRRSASLMSIPSLSAYSSSRMSMPLGSLPGMSCSVSSSSPIEQSIPFDSTPRSLPALITTSPGSFATGIAAGTIAPSNTFCAPVTICTTSEPIST